MGRQRKPPSQRLPGGATEDELRALAEPTYSDELVARLLHWSAKASPDEIGAYEDAREALPRPPGDRLVLVLHVTPYEHPEAFARFAALALFPGSVPREHAGDLWVLTGYLGPTARGEAAIVRLAVEPWPAGEETEAAPVEAGITSTVLRLAARASGEIVARARAELQAAPAWSETLEGLGLAEPDEEARERARAAAEAAAAAPLRRGRKGYPEDHYRRIALLYLDLQAQGVGRGILNRIAERESKRLGRSVPRETARDWVRGARERGFLTGGTRGRAGAQPGPNLYTIDDEGSDEA